METDSTCGGGSVPPGLPMYHPGSALGGRPGYYPNVSPEQQKCVVALRGLIETNALSCFEDEENEYLKMLRFLRARKFDVQKAYTMLAADVAWRSDKKDLRHSTSADILGCDSAAMYTYFPTWMYGFDKQQRPVSWRQFGKFEINKVLKLTTMDKLIRFHGWETEQAVRKMHEQSKATSYNIETFVLVVDAAGWHLSLATSDAFTFIKGMASTDSDHYPERLGTMLLINAPSVLSFAWRVIQAFLDDVTKAKIRIMGTDPKEWQPVLFDLIDRENVPEMYGGLAPNPTPETAFASMDPPLPHPAAPAKEGEEESKLSPLPPAPPTEGDSEIVETSTSVATTTA
jgi:CRAL/TRIO domain/CRAL/TRIO, N-terminal domain